jgi:quinohemoprotein ethanol dehydrogenase
MSNTRKLVRAALACAALASGIGSLAVAVACGRAGGHELDDAALRNADADSAQWLSYGRTYSEQRHSPLNQIDEASVPRLGLAWSVDMQTRRGLEATPLESDGVLYVSSAWSVVSAIDARTGKVLWRHDPAVPKDHAKFVCCDVVNRGVALYGDQVYVGTIDGRLVALDRKTGAVMWSVQTTPKDGPYSITGAPRVAGGKVVIGNAGSEYAVRGFVSAYDANTGALAWKTYLVPGDPSKPFEQEALRRAAATWSGQWYKAGGGASPWDPIVYDPSLDLVFVGSANANPWYPELRGDKEGDNLYASSIIAIRASTGEIVWHYQTTPGDSWDYDATQPITLADLTIDGRPRKVLIQPNKNAFLYVIDRETGKLISATPYASMTWATGIDSTGRPIVNPAAKPTAMGAIVSPADYGAHNWNPTSFSPTTGFLYLSVTDGGVLLHVVDPKFKLNANDRTMGIDPRYAGPLKAKRDSAPPAKGRLVAWNPVTKREAWRVEHPGLRSGGTLSTAGNLVFQGRGDGIFAAYRATDGTMVWKYDAQVGIAAAPMTYAIDGVQYVAILAGPPGYYLDPKIRLGPGRLLVFALDGKDSLPPNPVHAPTPIPPPTFAVNATPAEITEGGGLWFQYCRRCHNPDFNYVKGGSIPDLRRANEATHATFEQIVRGGARRTLGMPSFAKDISSDQVRMIQAYVLDQARQVSDVGKSAEGGH